MSYIYLIQESMNRNFSVYSNTTIVGLFTGKKKAIEALIDRVNLVYRAAEITKHRTYIYWQVQKKPYVERYFRILQCEANRYSKPGLLNAVEGKEVVIFPELKE